jgi:hypothetical protein
MHGGLDIGSDVRGEAGEGVGRGAAGEDGDGGGAEGFAPDGDVVDLALVEGGSAGVVREADVDSALPVEVGLGFVACGDLDAIDVDALAGGGVSDDVGDVVPLVIGVVFAGGGDGFVVPGSCADVSAAEVEVAVVTVGTEVSGADGVESGVGLSGAEPEGAGVGGLGDVEIGGGVLG